MPFPCLPSVCSFQSNVGLYSDGTFHSRGKQQNQLRTEKKATDKFYVVDLLPL